MTGETILVAEDDESSSEMLREMLEQDDYTVEVAETAGDVVNALRARGFAAVLEQSALLQDLIGAGATFPLSSPSRRELQQVAHYPTATTAPLQRQEDVVLHREPAEDLLSLEGPPESAAGALHG